MKERKEKPVVSVLMPVYNVEEFLCEAIESVLEQTYVQWELICINDGSTDNSLHILHQYQKKDFRIIVIDHWHSGLCATKNLGLEIACGLYIVALDSDDKIEPTYLEKLIIKQQETQADIVVASIDFWDYENNIISKSLTGVTEDISIVISGRKAFELSLRWEIGGKGLHYTEVLKKIKYCETGANGDEYTTRLLFLHASKVAFSDAHYLYRNNLNSMSKKFSVEHFSTILIDAMLLTLIRKNTFYPSLSIKYKEDIVGSLLYGYVKYLRRRKSLLKNERKIAIYYLWKATVHIGKELFSPPFSIKSSVYILYKIFKAGVQFSKKIVMKNALRF